MQHGNKKKEVKGTQIRKQEIKLSLSIEDKTDYVRGGKEKLLELFSEFSKVVRYKINIQKVIH